MLSVQKLIRYMRENTTVDQVDQLEDAPKKQEENEIYLCMNCKKQFSINSPKIKDKICPSCGGPLTVLDKKDIPGYDQKESKKRSKKKQETVQKPAKSSSTDRPGPQEPMETVEEKAGTRNIIQCMKCGKVRRDVLLETDKHKCEACGSENVQVIYREEDVVKEKDIHEQDTFRVIGKGITDEKAANDLARSKDGEVVPDSEDDKKFMVIVKETVSEAKLNEGEQKLSFASSVEVGLRIEGVGVEGVDYKQITKSVELEYDLTLVTASWGIDEIRLSFMKPIEVIWNNGEGEHSVSVNLDDADIIWIRGKQYAPDRVDINLDADGNIDGVDFYMSYLVKE